MKFHLWSFLHFYMIIAPFIIAYILYKLYKDKSNSEKRKLGLILSVFSILLLLFRNIELFILQEFKFGPELVPLQICHFANFVLLLAFYKKSDTLFGLAFLFNLPLAFLSLLFADGLEIYTSIANFRGQAYIWGHMLIVITTLYAYLVGMIHINIKKYFQIAQLVTLLYIISVFVNQVFKVYLNVTSNYFYTELPELGTPLEYFYSLGEVIQIGVFNINIVYMLAILLFGYVTVFIFYLVSFELPKVLYKKQKELSKEII